MAVELLTVAEAARMTTLSRATIYRRVAAGELEATRLGFSPKAPIRVTERAIKALIDLDDDEERHATS